MKHTKEVILSAYEKALKEIEVIKSSQYNPQQEKQHKKQSDQVAAGMSAANETESLHTSVESITSAIQKHVSAILGAYDDSSVKLKDIQSAIDIKKQELQDLHDIETNVDTLAAVINAHNKTMQSNSEQHLLLMKSQKEELEAIKAEIKQAYIDYKEALSEFEAELEKDKTRKEEEFEYEFERTKKIKTDEMNDRIKGLLKEVYDKDQELTEREAKVKEREAFVEELEEKVEGLPDRIQEAVEYQEIHLTRKLEAEHQLEIAKLKAQYESSNAILSNRVTMLEETLAGERAAHKDTSAKLETAYGRMEKVATASVEGARTEDAVNRVLHTMSDNKK